MEMYGLDHERISDYGCRKVLGMNKPVNAYINGYPKTSCDSFVSSKKNDDLKKTVSYFGLGGAIALGFKLLTKVLKR